MSEEAKINAGILFSPADPKLKALKVKTHKLNLDDNCLYENEVEKRNEIIHKIVGDIEPFYCETLITKSVAYEVIKSSAPICAELLSILTYTDPSC